MVRPTLTFLGFFCLSLGDLGAAIVAASSASSPIQTSANSAIRQLVTTSPEKTGMISLPGSETSLQCRVDAMNSTGLSYIANFSKSDPATAASFSTMIGTDGRDGAIRLAVERWLTEDGSDLPDRGRGGRGRIDQTLNSDLALAVGHSPRTLELGNLMLSSGSGPESSGGGLYWIGLNAQESLPLKWVSGVNAIYDDGIVASVPEPAAALLSTLGALVLLRRRRDS